MLTCEAFPANRAFPETVVNDLFDGDIGFFDRKRVCVTHDLPGLLGAQAIGIAPQCFEHHYLLGQPEAKRPFLVSRVSGKVVGSGPAPLKKFADLDYETRPFSKHGALIEC